MSWLLELPFVEKYANVRCINCNARFLIWDVRSLLSRNRVFEQASKPFWEMGALYDKPEHLNVKCRSCMIELQLRKGRGLIVEAAFWIGGCVLTVALIYAALVLIVPERPPIDAQNLADQTNVSLRQQMKYSKTRGDTVIFLMFALLPIPPLSFFIARVLSYRLVAFEMLPRNQRAAFSGLPQ